MQKYTNKGSVPWHPRESRSPCKNAANDSTIASSISWWQGWHLFHCISPMSLQDGKKKIFTDKQQLATGFACSSRTVSPDEHCYRLICASCTQFHVPLGTQAFQLPQAASKQRSVSWCFYTKPREVQEMLKIPVGQSSLVSRTFSVHIRIWMFTLCTMHLVSTSTSEPRKEVLGNLYNFMH